MPSSFQGERSRRRTRLSRRAHARSASSRSGSDREFRAAVPADLACDEPAVDRETARRSSSRHYASFSKRPACCSRALLPARPSTPFRPTGNALRRSGPPSECGTLSFADFLAAHDWYADARALTLFSHWITPLSEPRRYNTHFFFAAAPPDQGALADAFETHDGIWIAPALALERQRAGTLHLVYPTIKHLERLAGVWVGRRRAGLCAKQTGVDDRAQRCRRRFRDTAGARERMVTLVRAPNPSAMTLQGTNSYVLDCGDGDALVIDPGPAIERHAKRSSKPPPRAA